MDKSRQRPSKQQQKRLKKQQKQNTKKGKQTTAPHQESSSESENADIDLNHLQGETEQMQVSFIIGEIQDQYYHSLKTILLRYATITKTTNSQLADAIVANKTLGNVVLADDQDDQQLQEEEQDKEEGEDDEENVYSIITILGGKSGLGKHIRQFVLKAIEKKEFPEEVSKSLRETTTSVLLNQRLPNLPAFVVNSSHQVFKKDLLQLQKKQPKKYDELMSGYLLNVSEVQFEGEEELDKLIYSKFEDYELCSRAWVWWIGGANPSHRKKADMRSLYYLITPQQYLQGVDQIKSYLAE